MARHSWKILKKLIKRKACFKIGQQGFNRDSSPFEHRGTTDNIRVDGNRQKLEFRFVDDQVHRISPLYEAAFFADLPALRY